jgi:surface antigen
MLPKSVEIRKHHLRSTAAFTPIVEGTMKGITKRLPRLAKHSAALGLLAFAITACGDAVPTGSTTATVQNGTVTPPSLAVSPGVAGRIASGGVYNLRAGPGTNHAVVGTIAGGTAVWISCQEYGTTHTGPWGTTNIWDKLSTGAWIADAYVYTGRNGLVAPLCRSTTPPGIAPGVRGNNYPYWNDPRVFNPNGCVGDEWAFCKRNCTSFVAFRLNRVNGIGFHNRYRSTTNNASDKWSHAMSWADRARRLGYAVDRTPRVGDVAHWNKSASMPYGHVAWVASVSSDGRYVTLEEYNADYRGNYRSRTIATSAVNNFIHLR